MWQVQYHNYIGYACLFLEISQERISTPLGFGMILSLGSSARLHCKLSRRKLLWNSFTSSSSNEDLWYQRYQHWTAAQLQAF
jgi:hypothetical protein